MLFRSDQVGEFVEIAKLTYPDPVKEKIKAQKAQQEAEAFKEEKECAEREKNEEVCKAEQAKAAEKKKEEKSEKETAASKPVSRPSLDKLSDYPESNSFEKTYQSFLRGDCLRRLLLRGSFLSLLKIKNCCPNL